jgi:transcriptional regulator with XRE-family HTH domain
MRGLSQSDLATKTGLQPAAISHFETGARRPSFENLRRLAVALDVSTDYLLGRVDSPEESAGADVAFRGYQKLSDRDRQVVQGLIAQMTERIGLSGEPLFAKRAPKVSGQRGKKQT